MRVNVLALSKWSHVYSPLIIGIFFGSTQGISYTPVEPSYIDLSQLGQVALAGNFDGISLYTYTEQNENVFSTNGSQSLIAQFPNGAFATFVSADASITDMCPFVMQDGTLAGIVVAGNFTSLGGIEAQGAAMVDPNSGNITPLPGLTGSIAAVLCDQATNTVYMGGDFKGGNSTNAIAWVGVAGWTNLPFAGFNGPVSTIAKAENGNVLFGGSFTNLGNTTTPTIPDQQVVNIATANISAGGTTTTAGFDDPRNILCKTAGADGGGNVWLLADNTPGFWRADMNYGYEPTKLRIYNTHQDGRGAKTFRFTAFPIDGIMNLTYTDPVTNVNATCDARCPLTNDSSIEFQDFHFVNLIGMNSFQIDISDWYGGGGGLTGIQLYQDDIYVYAVQDLNEPACASIKYGSNATTTGPWRVTPSGTSGSEYLTLDLTDVTSSDNPPSIIFEPDIKQSGNYTVTIYTPGCQQDSSCASRGIVNVTGTFATGAQSSGTQQKIIYQTNDFDKYDQIYSGYVSANSASFRPTVTLIPLAGQADQMQLVAHRVRFQLQQPSSGGDLNGLFEFNSDQANVNMEFSKSNFDVAGTALSNDASITTIQVTGQAAYVAGNFSGENFSNIFSIGSGNATSLPNGGLNGQVITSYLYGNLLYLGGEFTNTSIPSIQGLEKVAVFDTDGSIWLPLGAGLNGRVYTIVPLSLNITAGQPETCITFNGDFDTISAFDTFKTIEVSDGMAIWVPSRNNWLQNLGLQTMSISGQLTTATNISGSSPLLAGAISSQALSANDAISLTSSDSLSLGSLGVEIQPPATSSSNVEKRATNSQSRTGVVTGLYNTDGGRNLTILGGRFTALAGDGSMIADLAFISNLNDNVSVTGLTNGLDTDSTFLALAANGDNLYAGGLVTGKVNQADVDGLIVWDLASNDFASPQPPALIGDVVSVNAISIRPNTTDVYVSGSFNSAGSLSCPSICIFSGGQWSRPGLDFTGNVSTLIWQGKDKLLVGGSLTVTGNTTSLANYDASKQVWSAVPGANAAIPGPVTAITPADSDASSFWLAGLAANGSAFLIKYDGSEFSSPGDVFGEKTTILGLSMLSVTKDHGNTDLIPRNMVLLLTGQLNLIGFGNVSAALYNGSTFQPFLLSTSGNNPGSLSQMITQKQLTFNAPGGHLALIFVVLIALACALACVFLLVVLGLLIERRRRRKEGYRPAPTTAFWEKSDNMGRIPPDQLFGRLGSRNGARPERL
ncbi:hypothetical protein MMC25_002869 [Agyrium rufum]|nr:hypothetical protein [Agyrium rufum]